MTDRINTIVYNRQLIYHLIILIISEEYLIKKILQFVHQLLYLTYFLKVNLLLVINNHID